MTVKTETNFWKTLKEYLNRGDYIYSRLESYVTPGFPDCLVYHRKIGFFTLELKVANSSLKVVLSPFQIAWNSRHGTAGAQAYILASIPDRGEVKMFHGCKSMELGQKTVDQVPGLYEGPLADLDFCQVVSNSQTP